MQNGHVPPPGPGSLYRGISAAWLRQATFGTLRHGGYGVLEAAGKDARNQAGMVVDFSWNISGSCGVVKPIVKHIYIIYGDFGGVVYDCVVLP